MSQKRNHKICLVGECLSTGGAEKTMALLSQFFASKDIEVHLVIVIDSVAYPYSGELLNLGKMKNATNGVFNKISRFRTFKKYLERHQFDFIIDFRVRVSFLQEYFISKFLYDAPTMYTVHSAMTTLYFPKSKWQAKAIYRNAYSIAAVSTAIAEIIEKDYGLQNVATIHNPVDLSGIETAANAFKPAESHYILAAGRMKDDVKQFGKLIHLYAKSALPEKNIKLIILGDGKLRPELQKLVSDLNLQQFILLKGHVQNPFPYMKNALFFVLSSRNEGLPTVILETLACGTPVISFDCVSGPAEMISNRQNGLLVKDQDFGKLAEAIELLASDTALYERCKANAKQSITAFSLENIGRQWLEFLKINVS